MTCSRPASNARLIEAIVAAGQAQSSASEWPTWAAVPAYSPICCGEQGCIATGLDLSPKLIEHGASDVSGRRPSSKATSSICRFPTQSLDAVVFSGIVHHLPDPSRCAAEVFRVLRPGGRFVAFDPNRMNPFMWALPRPVLAVLQLGRGNRERAPGARARGRGDVQAGRLPGRHRVSSRACAIATLRRPRCAGFYRSIMPSTACCSALPSWGRSAPSC